MDKNSGGGAGAGCLGCLSGCLTLFICIVPPILILLMIPLLVIQGMVFSIGSSIEGIGCQIPGVPQILNLNCEDNKAENVDTGEAVLGFKSPIKNISFTAPGYPWGAPNEAYPGLHHVGVDLGSTDGDTSVYAMIDAKVYKTHTGFANSYSSLPANIEGQNIYGIENYKLEQGGGNQVILEFEHEAWPGKKVYLNYVHLASVAVSAGQQVKQGDYLGEYGQSGGAQGAHLHLTLASGSSWATAVDEDPMKILSGLPGSEVMPGYRPPKKEEN